MGQGKRGGKDALAAAAALAAAEPVDNHEDVALAADLAAAGRCALAPVATVRQLQHCRTVCCIAERLVASIASEYT